MKSTSTEWVYGYHAVRTLLSAAPERIKTLFLQPDHVRNAELRTLAHSMGVSVQPILNATLVKALGAEANHQGVACQCQSLAPSESDLKNLLSIAESSKVSPLVLVLDGIEDPHNLGACLRSANVFGATCVI